MGAEDTVLAWRQEARWRLATEAFEPFSHAVDAAALTFTSGECADWYWSESRGSYVSVPRGKLGISYTPFSEMRDTVSVLGTDR